MPNAIQVIQSVIDAAQSEIDKLNNIDTTPRGRKLTAKAFMNAAMALGATVEGIAAIETHLDKLPHSATLQRAWISPVGLVPVLEKEFCSRPLSKLGGFMDKKLETTLTVMVRLRSIGKPISSSGSPKSAQDVSAQPRD